MADWVVAVGGDRFQGERLYQADAVEVAVPAGVGVLPGDRVVLAAEDAGVGVVFGVGRVARPVVGGVAEVAYTHRLVDRLVPAADAPKMVAEEKIGHSLVVVALYHFDLWQRGIKKLKD